MGGGHGPAWPPPHGGRMSWLRTLSSNHRLPAIEPGDKLRLPASTGRGFAGSLPRPCRLVTGLSSGKLSAAVACRGVNAVASSGDSALSMSLLPFPTGILLPFSSARWARLSVFHACDLPYRPSSSYITYTELNGWDTEQNSDRSPTGCGPSVLTIAQR